MIVQPGKQTIFAVLTGDLVHSTALDPNLLTQARSALEEGGTRIACWSPDAVIAPVEFFRGDSWQLALGDPRLCLRAAIYLRARLRACDKMFDTKVSIGLGRAEQIDTERTSLSTGEAFLLSGRTLDKSGAAGLSVGIPPYLVRELGWLQPLARLCAVLVDGWTKRQAEIVARMLPPSKIAQNTLASTMGIKPQTLSKALGGAEYPALAAALDYIETLDWSHLEHVPAD